MPRVCAELCRWDKSRKRPAGRTNSNRRNSKLGFPHFASPGRQVMTQKISSEVMKRSASSIDKTVRPKGPVETHRSFHEDQ
jgi:hypothetical protein